MIPDDDGIDGPNQLDHDLCDVCLIEQAAAEFREDGLVSVDLALQLFARGYSLNDVELVAAITS